MKAFRGGCKFFDGSIRDFTLFGKVTPFVDYMADPLPFHVTITRKVTSTVNRKPLSIFFHVVSPEHFSLIQFRTKSFDAHELDTFRRVYYKAEMAVDWSHIKVDDNSSPDYTM